MTPDFLVQGGDNLGGLLSAFLTNIISGPEPGRNAAAPEEEVPSSKSS